MNSEQTFLRIECNRWNRSSGVASFLAAMLLLGQIVGCTYSNTVSFRDLCLFDQAQFGTANSPDVLARIRARYHIEPRQETDGNGTRYSWGNGRTMRDAALQEGHLVGFVQRDIENGPTLGQVVAELGTPEMVYRHSTVFEGVQYTVMLEYPTKGVTVGAYRVANSGEVKPITGGWAVHLTEGISATFVNCYLPKYSVDEYLSEVFRVPPESMSMQKHRRIDWPGFQVWIPLD